MKKIVLKENERIDDLQINGMQIIQNKEGFCFGMDSVLLSDFAKEIKKGAKCVDLGTGTGIIGILLCAKTELSEMIGVEVQEEVVEMASRSIVLNHLEDRFKILNINIKETTNILSKNSFDYVVMNPPYKKMETGKINENEKLKISRHEIMADLGEFIKTAHYLLKDRGTLYMVHRPERLADIIQYLRKEKLEPKKIRFVYPKQNKESNLILIKAVKNANPFLKIEKPLYIYKEDSSYTSEILEIYHMK